MTIKDINNDLDRFKREIQLAYPDAKFVEGSLGGRCNACVECGVHPTKKDTTNFYYKSGRWRASCKRGGCKWDSDLIAFVETIRKVDFNGALQYLGADKETARKLTQASAKKQRQNKPAIITKPKDPYFGGWHTLWKDRGIPYALYSYCRGQWDLALPWFGHNEGVMRGYWTAIAPLSLGLELFFTSNALLTIVPYPLALAMSATEIELFMGSSQYFMIHDGSEVAEKVMKFDDRRYWLPCWEFNNFTDTVEGLWDEMQADILQNNVNIADELKGFLDHSVGLPWPWLGE